MGAEAVTVLEREGGTVVFAGGGSATWEGDWHGKAGPGLADPESQAWVSPPSGWRERVADFVKRALLEYQADWDGMGADAPTFAAAKAILAIVKQLPVDLDSLPEVLVTSVGGFCLEWADDEGVSLTIEAGTDGSISRAERGIDY